ncbi:MAG: hypothetical protein WC878_06290 [Candidatus Paceibacterota bacterium]|jgi:hypothetical protein
MDANTTRTDMLRAMIALAKTLRESNDQQLRLASASLFVIAAALEKEQTAELSDTLIEYLTKQPAIFLRATMLAENAGGTLGNFGKKLLN